ncbi:hypothetical protein B0T24DRAFT_327081 [Lasiosphaeria ovina]|uniref:Uncharacterized protein n=1 Tax=Lasiosphaeria ovina TaxID=92902 RepID=A0AAE0K8R1_9PEZI|nr:hypothetical protein B0T24DRAFT_327081 [Lasiosphaeria ovina]
MIAVYSYFTLRRRMPPASYLLLVPLLHGRNSETCRAIRQQAAISSLLLMPRSTSRAHDQACLGGCRHAILAPMDESLPVVPPPPPPRLRLGQSQSLLSLASTRRASAACPEPRVVVPDRVSARVCAARVAHHQSSRNVLLSDHSSTSWIQHAPLPQASPFNRHYRIKRVLGSLQGHSQPAILTTTNDRVSKWPCRVLLWLEAGRFGFSAYLTLFLVEPPKDNGRTDEDRDRALLGHYEA